MADPWGSSWGTSWGTSWSQHAYPLTSWGRSWGNSWGTSWQSEQVNYSESPSPLPWLGSLLKDLGGHFTGPADSATYTLTAPDWGYTVTTGSYTLEMDVTSFAIAANDIGFHRGGVLDVTDYALTASDWGYTTTGTVRLPQASLGGGHAWLHPRDRKPRKIPKKVVTILDALAKEPGATQSELKSEVADSGLVYDEWYYTLLAEMQQREVESLKQLKDKLIAETTAANDEDVLTLLMLVS